MSKFHSLHLLPQPKPLTTVLLLICLSVFSPLAQAQNACENLEQNEEYQSFVTQGIAALQGANYDEAFTLFSQATEICDADPGVLYYLARIKHLQGDCQAALVYYQESTLALSKGLIRSELTVARVQKMQDDAQACADEEERLRREEEERLLAENAPEESEDGQGGETDGEGDDQPSAIFNMADTATWMLAFAPRVGIAIPTSDLGPFVLAALEIDYFLPFLDNQLLITLDFAYTRPSFEDEVDDSRINGTYPFELSVDMFKVSLGAAYRIFDADALIVPYVGLALAVHMLKTTENSPLLQDEQSEQSTAVGVDVAVGADLKLGPGLLLAELRWLYAGLQHDLTGSSNSGYVGILLGYRIGF